MTTATIVDDSVKAIETINGNDEAGDATVPRLAATPNSLRPNSPVIRWIPDQHGSLQSNQALLDEIEGVLTSQPVIHRASFAVPASVSASIRLCSPDKRCKWKRPCPMASASRSSPR